MNFFIKILDDINPIKASDYTAWYVENLMKRYSEKQKKQMWEMLGD